MTGETKIIIIGEANEIFTLFRQFSAQFIQLSEKRIVQFQKGAASKSESSRGEIGKAFMSCH